MGAFNVELARLGYKSFVEESTQKIPATVIERRLAIEAMHLARMPCPGSCGQICPNHYCPAHNGETYKRKL